MRVVQGCTMAVAQSRCKDAATQTTAFRHPAPPHFVITNRHSPVFWCWGANSHCAGRARMHDGGRTESLHDAATPTTAFRQPRPATLPLSQTGIALLFLVLGGELAQSVHKRARMHDSGRTKSAQGRADPNDRILTNPATLSLAQRAGYYFWCWGEEMVA